MTVCLLLLRFENLLEYSFYTLTLRIVQVLAMQECDYAWLVFIACQDDRESRPDRIRKAADCPVKRPAGQPVFEPKVPRCS